ncbi:hypothetical protein RNN44_07965, partial [Escherichia coli]|nr:hypothetical protein [Escherichia coli]
DRNRSHWSTSKTPSYTKSVSWQHHPSHQEKQLKNQSQYLCIFLNSFLKLTPGMELWVFSVPNAFNSN